MNEKKMNEKFFLISNMYPSPENVRYGIFVKNFEKAIEKKFDVRLTILTKKKRILSKLLSYIVLYFKIFLINFKVKKNDIIYVHFPLYLAPILFVFKKNLILNFHGSDLIIDSPLKRFFNIFQKKLILKSTIVVPSSYYEKKILEKYQTNSSKIFIYPSGGINKNIFKPIKSISKNIFTIGYVSNFIKSKGWHVFLKAMVFLKENNLIPHFKIIMVGDGQEKQNIESFIKHHNLNTKIMSNLSQPELNKVYNMLDVFVFPTYREAESLGLVGIEAMACGVPVIASRIGGPMGYIINGENGYLFEKQNISDLVDKLMQFYTLEKSKKMKMVNKAIKTSNLYDKNIVNKKLIDFLYNSK